jgi:hypothetical protein
MHRCLRVSTSQLTVEKTEKQTDTGQVKTTPRQVKTTPRQYPGILHIQWREWEGGAI